MQPLYEIVYVSESRLPRDAHAHQLEIDRIIAQARARNERDGITGALIVGRTHFAQVLEGQLGTLEAALRRIEKDARHSNVVVVRMAPIAVRSWPTWSMSMHLKGAPEALVPSAPDLPPSEQSSLCELQRVLSLREDAAGG